MWLEYAGHRARPKWHRARRRATDTVFNGARIREGLAEGASIEIDLVRHGSGGFAVLHDETLDCETTGTGPVARHTAADLRRLKLRDNAGNPTELPVLLFDDLCAAVAVGKVHPQSLLQLDLQEPGTVFTAADINAFQQAAAPVARNMILTGGDAAAVALLSRDVEGLRTGYDPCEDPNLSELRASGDYAEFVRAACATAPDAKFIYLEIQFVMAADASGFNVIAAFQETGRPVDAWTMTDVRPEHREGLRRLLELGADQITTDDPDGLLALAATL